MRQTIVLLSPAELDLIEARIALLENQQTQLRKELEMANEALARLQQEVAENASVIDSAINLISGIAAQLQAVKDELAAVGVTNDALNTLADDLDAKAGALAEAIAANTPAEPTPPPAQ